MVTLEKKRVLPAQARVIRQHRVGEGLYELWCEAPALAGSEPGQFVHVRCGEGFLRRPFSLYRVSAFEFALLYRIKGRGTRWLSGLQPGAVLDVLGPLGRPFTAPGPGERLLLVGGGVGVAPLAHFAQHYRGGFEGMAVVGFRNAAQVAGTEPFAEIPLALYTEDGSTGIHGRLTDGLAARIAEAGVSRVLACGPEPMLRAVSGIAAELGVACEISVERPMACGIGVCLGCVVPLKDEAGPAFERACLEGPVFDARRVQWSLV